MSARTRPKVLVAGHFPPSAGGITSLLLTTFRSPLREQIDLVPFNIGRRPKRTVIHNFGYHAILNAGLKRATLAITVTLAHMIMFPVALMRHRPAVAHVHTAPYLVFWETSYYVFCARVLGVPCVLQFHSSFRLFYEASGQLARRLMLRVIRAATVFAVISSEDLEFLTGARGRGARCVYLPNFIDIEAIRTAVHAAKERADLDGGVSVLFFGGSDASHKGFFHLLRAIREIGQSLPQLRFDLVAVPAGDVEQGLPADLLSRCTVHRWLTGTDKTAVLARADMLVLPSHAEGMPISILEAMACSVPVIASRVGGIPDMIAHGRHGRLIEPGDHQALAAAIQALAEDGAARAAMGHSAFKRATESYDVSAGVRRLLELYEGLLPSAHPRSDGASEAVRDLGKTPQPHNSVASDRTSSPPPPASADHDRHRFSTRY